MFDYILFDLDGTLMDSSRGIFKAYDRVVSQFKLDVPRSDYPLMIGPPLREGFTKVLKVRGRQLDAAIRVYREAYVNEGIFEADIYPGVVELIKALCGAGKKTFVATSKPEALARRVLEHKGIATLFDFTGGAESGAEIETAPGEPPREIRSEKRDVIEYVLRANGVTDKGKCVLIGDRFYDVRGAHAAGIRCIGVLWGFGKRAELEEYGADWIFASPEGVRDFLLKG